MCSTVVFYLLGLLKVRMGYHRSEGRSWAPAVFRGTTLVEIVDRVGVNFMMGRCYTTLQHTMPPFFRQLGLKSLCDGSFLHKWY